MGSAYLLTDNRTNSPFIIDIVKFLLLIGVTIILVYYLPSPIYTKIAFLFFLPLIFYSKENFLWLAWFFIIIDAPGLLFKGGLVDDPNRIPLYTLTAGISISFTELFITVYLLKIFTKYRNKKVFVFTKLVQLFALLVVLYVVITVLFFEFNVFTIFRATFPWTLVYIFYVVLNNEQDLNRFSNIIFLAVFFVVIAQVYSFISGEHLVNILKPQVFHVKSHLSKEISTESTLASRTLYSMFLIFYATIFSLVNIFKKGKTFNKPYLYLVLIFSFFGCILSGTRGYLLAISFIIIISFLANTKKISQISSLLLLVLGFSLTFYLLQMVSPVVEKQLELVGNRFETMFSLLSGDMTAGGTVGRLTERVPVIMKFIRESPLFGFGFSDIYFENADSDIGFFTNVLNIGFLGIILLYSLFFSLLNSIYKKTKTSRFLLNYGNIGSIFIIGFLGIQIFHFTTNIAFGLHPVVGGALYERYMIYGLLLAALNSFITNSNPLIKATN